MKVNTMLHESEMSISKIMLQPRRIAIIGSGNVATQIALAASAAGMQVVAVYSRTKQNAEVLAGRLDNCLATDVCHALPDADFYIIAVKDDAIPGIAQQLVEVHPDALVVHTAGSVGMDVLCKHFVRCGVVYPMQTFSRDRVLDFAIVPIFVEGSQAAVTENLRTFAEQLSRRVTVLDSEGRRYLHLASVFACNFVNHCYDKAFGICAEHGIDPMVLLPLIDETAAKVHSLSPHNGQTGPARRGDTTVIDGQRALLNDNPELRRLYDSLSASIIAAFSSK